MKQEFVLFIRANQALFSRIILMASEPTVNGTAGMDYKEHDATYGFFIQLVEVLTPLVITWVVALGVGAVKGSWGIATILFIISTVAGVMGLFSKSVGYKPIAGVLVLSLLALALA
jgi:Bacterial aa3 type cytochrome c oxidase subunit IV